MNYIGQAFQFLRDHNEGVLATVADGKPQTRVFQVMRAEGTMHEGFRGEKYSY